MSDAIVPIQPAFPLHDYQRQVAYEVLDALRGNQQSGQRGRALAHLPTGAGKTRIASYAVAALLSEARAEGKVVIWLASAQELCEQAADSLIRAWHHLGNRDIHLHRLWGQRSGTLDDVSEGFVVAGLAKLHAASQTRTGALTSLANRAVAVVFDEAHQAIAPTYEALTNQLTAYGAALLGLTATPGRTSRIEEEDHRLAALFNEQKISIDPQGHENAMAYLIRHEYLAEPEFIQIPTNSGIEVLEPTKGTEYRSDDLVALGRTDAWKQMLIGTAREASKYHDRIIAFCPSVASARAAAEAFSDSNVVARTVTANTAEEDRYQITAEFRSDSPQPMVLFNYGVFTAGFDAPRTSCVIVARPTNSLVLYSQMVGRAMRGRRSGGNRRCTIYSFVDSTQESFKSVIAAFDHWEELWNSPPNN